MGTEIATVTSHEIYWQAKAVPKYQVSNWRENRKEELAERRLNPRELRKILTGRGCSVMAIFSWSSQQISSYFSRHVAKRSVEVDQPDSKDETAAEDLQNVLRDKVLSEVSIQLSHPIIYNSYKICEPVFYFQA